MNKRFYKSNDRKISGVCAGIAEYFNWDPTIIRVLWAVLTLCTSGFPGIILYIVLALVMPNRPSNDADWDNMKRANTENSEDDKEFNSYFSKDKEKKDENNK